MASLGHIAIGIAASRLYPEEEQVHRASLGAMLFWAALSFLPDADVIGFSFGVQYADEWGHRGATHSLAFAVVIGSLAGVAARLVHRPALRTGVTAVVVLASHPLLDTLTDGGLGCALFWPFDHTRYFAPWRPFPVAPIGLAFFSPYGLFVAFAEALLFAPVWWYAFAAGSARSRRVRIFSLAAFVVWCAALWLLMSADPLRERVLAAALRDRQSSLQVFPSRRSALSHAGRPSRRFAPDLVPRSRSFCFTTDRRGRVRRSD